MLDKKVMFWVGMMLFVVGCSTTSITRSGFLSDYTGFKPAEKNKDVLVNFPNGREKAFEQAKTYEAFIIDPIVVYFSPERHEKVGINPEALQEIVDYFYDELTKGLKEDGYNLVDSPGKGVMRVRIALTDVVPSKPYLNVHFATKATKAGVGGASVEAEFIDSLTEKRIAAVIYARQGRSIMFHKGFKKWDYAKDSLQQWALLVRTRLKELKEKNK